MQIFTADLSEILLAERRDEEEIEYLSKELSQIIKDLLGPHFWISYWNYYPTIATTLYYAVTFLSALQTVGEEYTALLPLVSGEQHRVPSFTRRFIFTFFFSIAPFFTEELLGRIERNLEDSFIATETVFSDRKRRNFLKVLYSFIVWIRCTCIPVLYRLNLALFYLFGAYYHISRRLVDLRYISLRPQSNYQVLSYFHFFGAVNVAQIVVRTIIWIKDELKKLRIKETVGVRQLPHSQAWKEKEDLLLYNSFCCSLCSESNKPPVCIPCGHLFCWNCISKHVQFSTVIVGLTFCPQCREEFHESRVRIVVNLPIIMILKKFLRQNARRMFDERNFRFISSFTPKSKNECFPIYVSGIQPTGVPHLGNYFGLIQQWTNLQNDGHSKQMYLSIADYHSISMGFVDSTQMRNNILKMAASLLACGLDPEKTILFQQSTVSDHVNLMYILGSLQTIARLTRMPQYKDKAAAFKQGDIPVNLQLYPILQAADVLLYKGTHVPVGDDQTQHLLLMRDLATKFNAVLHHDFFPVPVQITTKCKRLKSLQDAAKKMSKSMGNDRSRILINDTKQVIADKCAKALTDSQSNITYEPENRPAISNLVTLYALATGLNIEDVIHECAALDTKGFKSQLAERIDALIAPFRAKYEILLQEPQVIQDILMFGTQRAQKKAQETMQQLRELLGFNVL